MENNKKPGMFFLLLLTVLGTIGDGLSSSLGLIAALHANNLLSYIVGGMGGVVVTGFVAATDSIFASKSPLLIIIWVLATIVDAATSLVATTFYIVGGNQLSEAIDFTKLSVNLGNPQALLGFTLMILLTCSSMAVGGVLNNFLKELD